MLKRLKVIIAGLVLVVVPALSVGSVSAAACDPAALVDGCSSAQTSVCEGIGLVGNGNGCTEDTSSPTVNSTIRAVVTILTLIVGVASVIMIIIGGFRYITSGGDSTKVGSAKSTILYAVVGLVIVAMAQVIVRFTLNKTSSANNTATPSVSTPAPGEPCKPGVPC